MYNGQEGDRALSKESNGVTLGGQASAAEIRTRQQHLTGTFYNKGTALRWGACYPPGGPRAKDDRCPLCGEGGDSSAHILLACTHGQMEAMRIKRHDRSVRQIERFLRKHSHFASVFTVMMDACKASELAAHEAGGKRLPRWIIPDHLVSDEALAKMRPDILRIVGLPASPTQEDLERAIQDKRGYTVQVIEVGYCWDTKWREKVAEKMEQHKQLIELLEEAGWTVDKTPHVIVVGACGTVYHSGAKALQALGLTEKQSHELLRQLHFIAIEDMRNISLARRRLERSCVDRARKGVG